MNQTEASIATYQLKAGSQCVFSPHSLTVHVKKWNMLWRVHLFNMDADRYRAPPLRLATKMHMKGLHITETVGLLSSEFKMILKVHLSILVYIFTPGVKYSIPWLVSISLNQSGLSWVTLSPGCRTVSEDCQRGKENWLDRRPMTDLSPQPSSYEPDEL